MLSTFQNQLIQTCQTTLSPDTSVETAVRIMSQSKTSYVLILEQQKLVGIFTERDLVRAIATNLNLAHTTLADVMTSNVLTLPKSELQDLFSTLRFMRNYKIRHLPIVDQQGQLVGMITPQTIRAVLQPGDLLKHRLIAEVMTTKVVTAELSTSLHDLIQKMAENRVSCVVIVTKLNNSPHTASAVPIGIITERDIVKFKHLNLNFTQVTAQEVMTTPLSVTRPDESLWLAHQTMQNLGVRRLVVINNAGELEGIVTQTSVLQAIDPIEIYQVLESLQQLVDERTAELQAEIHQRQQLAQTLAQSQAQIEAILNSVRAIICRIRYKNNQDFEYEYISPNCVQLLGYSPDELLANPTFWYSLILPVKKDLVLAKIHEAICTQKKANLEYEIYHKDGSIHWVADELNSEWDETSQTWIVTIVTTDITERKQTEEALRASEERLQLALEASGDALWDWNIVTGEVYFNARWWEMLGYVPVEFPSEFSSWEELVHPDDKPGVINLLQAHLQDVSIVYNIDYRMLTKLGEWKWITSYGKVVAWNENGKPVRMAGTHRDIDERKRAEEALKEREAFLRAIGDNIPNGYIYQLVRELDGSDRFHYISAGVEKASNLKPEDILADSSLLYGKVVQEDIPYLKQKQTESIQNMSVFDVQVREYNPKGGISWSRLCSTPRRMDDGRIIWDGVRLDITDLKQTEETLRKSKALLAEAQRVAQIGNWEFDLATQKIIWTEQLFHILNLDPALGEPSYIENLQLYHPEDQEILHQAVEKSIRTGEPYKLILRLKPLPDGSIRYTEGIGRAEFNAAGQVIRLYGTAQDITERLRYEKALQEKEQFLASIYNGVEQPIFVVDVTENNEFNYVGLNAAHERVTGLLTTDLKGKTPQQALPPEIAASVQQHYQNCIAARTAISYEEHLVLRGEDTWWITSLTPLQDENGRIYRIVGTGINITERKRLELALQASEQRLNNILTTANASIVSLRVFGNFDWEYEYQSIASKNIFGYTPEEILRDKYLWISQVHPEDRENIIYPLLADFFAERTTSVEFRFLHQDGSLRWISATYSSHHDPENHCWVVTGVSIDISDRQQAEEKLKQSETWFRTLSESAPVGIFRTDAQGKNIYTNSRFQNICGLNFVESLGDIWMQSIHPEDLEKILSQWTILGREIQELRADVRYIYHDSIIRFCRLIIVPIISNPPEIMGYVGTIEDITQSRAIEKMKNEFISIVSHELRTPLASIRGALGLIASGVLKEQPETTQQMLDIASNDTERLVRLVNDILDLERLEANKFNFVKELHNVNDILRKSVETVTALATENNIYLQIISHSVEIYIDSDRIIQTLVNLISNSIKFSPPNSIITLEIEELEDSVLFKIKDQGRGIPKDKLESIFGRFQQVDASDSRQKGGTGLGLAICRLIVQQHGGKIWAESILGQGSTFYFTIPKTS